MVGFIMRQIRAGPCQIQGVAEKGIEGGCGGVVICQRRLQHTRSKHGHFVEVNLSKTASIWSKRTSESGKLSYFGSINGVHKRPVTQWY